MHSKLTELAEVMIFEQSHELVFMLFVAVRSKVMNLPVEIQNVSLRHRIIAPQSKTLIKPAFSIVLLERHRSLFVLKYCEVHCRM